MLHRTIALLAAGALLLGTAGAVSADPGARGHRRDHPAARPAAVSLQLAVSPVVVQGGRLHVVARLGGCSGRTFGSVSMTASAGSLGALTLVRAGTQGGGTSSRSCVWKGSLAIAATQAPGTYPVTVNATSTTVAGGVTTSAVTTRTKQVTVRAREADESAGTDRSSGTDDDSAGTDRSGGTGRYDPDETTGTRERVAADPWGGRFAGSETADAASGTYIRPETTPAA